MAQTISSVASFPDRRLFAVVVAHATVNAPITFWEQTNAGGFDVRITSAWYALQAGYAAAGLALVVLRWRWWSARETEWLGETRSSVIETVPS